MTTRPASLGDLTRLGEPALEHYRQRRNPPSTPLEWLGIAVGGLPELTARARTVDEVHWRSRNKSADLHAHFLEALLGSLGEAAAALEAARASLLARHPDSPGDNGDPEGYADLLETAHRNAPRRAEMMISGYASFVGGAIEAAGALAEAELRAARARRWEREDHEECAGLRAAQLHTAVTNALGGLLAYARLVATDRPQPAE